MRISAAPVSAATAAMPRVVLKTADVVDDRRAALHGRARHGGLVCVDGDRHGQTAGGQPIDDGQNAGELLVLGQRRRTRPRRFSADVDDPGPLLDHLARARDGAIDVEVEPAVSERVGRDVEDPHHDRAVAELQRRPARERNGVGQPWRRKSCLRTNEWARSQDRARMTADVDCPTDCRPPTVDPRLAYSWGSGLLSGGSGGTIDGRSFCARFEGSSATPGATTGLYSSSGLP